MRVLVVPGGGSSARGYFPGLDEQLGEQATVVELDPPGLDPDAGRRWLRLRDHARWLADAVRSDAAEPVVVVGHSLGALVALRLALDAPGRVAGLLLLDPSPPVFGALVPRPLLRLFAAVRTAGALLPGGRPPARPQMVPLATRIRWTVLGGAALAADVAAGGLGAVPTVVVSAGEHAPGSVFRRTHLRLAAWTADGRHEVWQGTTHGSLREETARIAETALALVRRVSD